MKPGDTSDCDTHAERKSTFSDTSIFSFSNIKYHENHCLDDTRINKLCHTLLSLCGDDYEQKVDLKRDKTYSAVDLTIQDCICQLSNEFQSVVFRRATHRLVVASQNIDLFLRPRDSASGHLLYTSIGSIHNKGILFETCPTYMVRLSICFQTTNKGKLNEWFRAVQNEIRKYFCVSGADYTALHLRFEDQIALHWPAIAVKKSDLTQIWLKRLATATLAQEYNVSSLTYRHQQNNRFLPVIGSRDTHFLSFVLSNGCEVTDTELLNPVATWSVGMDQTVHITESRQAGVLALVCSINPMGTVAATYVDSIASPCMSNSELADRAEATCNVIKTKVLASKNGCDHYRTVMRLLSTLNAKRQKTPKDQNEIGNIIHAITAGDNVGYLIWILWIYNFDDDDVSILSLGERMDYLHEWTGFGVNIGSDVAWIRLRNLSQSDSTYDRRRQFIYNERFLENHDRIYKGLTDGDCFFGVLGSMLHMDLARYVYHEIRNTVACAKSGLRSAVWYVFKNHRWCIDIDSLCVMRMCVDVLRTLSREMREHYQQFIDGAIDSDDNRKTRERQNLALTVNFPMLGSVDTAIKLMIMHLDSQHGDYRNLSNIMRSMSIVHDGLGSTIIENLDMVNHSLLPFENGVLDTKTMEFRDGIASDLLSVHIKYPFCLLPADHPCITEMEWLLTTIFPDVVVRDFFLCVVATLLHRRNRQKHFYIMTGNTNGGKSLLMTILREAFNGMVNTLPLPTITGRDVDASSHSDHLAKTIGSALCVINEPDCVYHTLHTDKVKQLTGDSDLVTVRAMYQSTREMMVSWKLFMACNTPPGFTNIDCAVVERTIFIPFLSSFVYPHQAPVEVSEQFRLRRFPRRSYDTEKVKQLGRALMTIAYTKYVHERMYEPTFTLCVPSEIRQLTEEYIPCIRDFKTWVAAYIRPYSVTGKPTNRLIDSKMKRVASHVISCMDAWKSLPENTIFDGVPFNELPINIQRDFDTDGSPAWVQQQCRMAFSHIDPDIATSVHTTYNLQVSVLDTSVILDAYEEFSKKSFDIRSTQQHNTVSQEEDDLCDQPKRRKTTNSRATKRQRVHLDEMFVHNVVSEITQRQLYASHMLGVCLISESTDHVDNDFGHVSTIRRALNVLMRQWHSRYRAPLFHADLIRPSDLKSAIASISMQPRQESDAYNSDYVVISREDARQVEVNVNNSSHVYDTVDDEHSVFWTVNISDNRQALACMASGAVLASSSSKSRSEKTQITSFEPGFTNVGSVPMYTNGHRMSEEDHNDEYSDLVRLFLGCKRRAPLIDCL